MLLGTAVVLKTDDTNVLRVMSDIGTVLGNAVVSPTRSLECS